MKFNLKSILTALTGVGMTLFLTVPILSLSIPNVYAQTLTENELFGGSVNGEEFATTAGLGTGELTTTIGSIIRVLLGFLGVVAVFIILLGGFKWMTSGGADAKVADAKKLMVAGVTGLVIILAAYAIASFAISSITTAISNAEI